MPRASESSPAAGDGDAAGLVLAEVSHAVGSQAILRRVNLDVAPGEILCLLGPSGCGKTTTLRLIAGLEELQAGRIEWNGAVLADRAGGLLPEERGVSLLFQDYALFPHLTAAENVAFGLAGLSRAEKDARVREVLEQVGMLEFADRYPRFLSGGEQQRIALARARAPKPRILLLDEPFSSLDTRLRTQTRDLCLHILKRSRSASLIVTHDAEEAMFMGDRIAVMREGTVVQAGSPEELYFHPADRFVAGLFGELNRIRGRVREGHVDTPIGRVCSPGIGEGAEADVLIRPEAIRIAPRSDAGAAGVVVAARLLGGSTLLHLAVADAQAGELHLHSRVPGFSLPPEGMIVGIRLESRSVFVFPADR